MAAVNGSTLAVDIGGNTVICETESSLEQTVDMIETTCKASGKNKTYLSGEITGTISVTAVYDETGTFGYSDAFAAAAQAGTELTWKWGSTAANEKFYTGSGLIADLTAEAPQNDRATWSFTLQVTGAITEATNPS